MVDVSAKIRRTIRPAAIEKSSDNTETATWSNQQAERVIQQWVDQVNSTCYAR